MQITSATETPAHPKIEQLQDGLILESTDSSDFTFSVPRDMEITSKSTNRLLTQSIKRLELELPLWWLQYTPTCSQACDTAISKATGNCILEASPLLQINNTTTSTVNKVFIYSYVKLCNFFHT
jgi:hypothetical protein